MPQAPLRRLAEPGQQIERMKPLGRAEQVAGAGKGGGFAHSASARISDRIASRISAARSGDRPGRTTMLLWVPAVWTTRRGGAEHLVDRAAGHVDMLDADERHDGVGVEQPAANGAQQPAVDRIAEPAVDAVGRDDDRAQADQRRSTTGSRLGKAASSPATVWSTTSATRNNGTQKTAARARSALR